MTTQNTKTMNTETKKKYNRISLLLGVPGILLQFLPSALVEPGHDNDWTSAALLLGVVLFGTGLSFLAKSKGRSAWWGVLGILSVVGGLIIAILKDRSADHQ
ncbi:hypothetical protein BH09VER1_BH09VER1_47510 [soil metagenome]